MIYELIIIGGGPAAASAGIYAARKKMKTLIIAETLAGQYIASSEVQNYPGFADISGMELNKKFVEHLKAQPDLEIKEGYKATLIEKSGDSFKVETEKGETFESKTILIASGKRYRKLGVPGEKEFEGKGVFYCAVCDAPLMKNKPVAVIGGGNSGLCSVVSLLPYASKIYILESAEALIADPLVCERARNSEKVEIITSAELKGISGNGFVKGLKYENVKTKETKELAVDGIFIAVGYVPNSEIAGNLVEIDQQGEILIDFKNMQTSCEGVWAAGDVINSPYHQISIAAGDGAKAALNIYDYLEKQKK